MDPEFQYQMDLAIYGLVLRLSALEAAAVENTRWEYAAVPEAADLAGFPADSLMLGLYVAPRDYPIDELLSPDLPPPTITLFAANIRLAGFSVQQVVTHEAGHRLGYAHSSAAIIPCGTEHTAMPDIVRAVESLPVDAPISCFC